jgi:ATP-dependent Lon protease
MPGLIVQALKRTGVNNPVILLDEIDKLGKDARGDPSSALLEVLDPEQNQFFTDHYLNMPFDLSKVLFIATANEVQTIPRPLMDRMELIQLSGYTIDEKLNIAKTFLMPKQVDIYGLEPNAIEMSEAVLEEVISSYTREAGVRNLEREIGSICRYLAVEYSEALDNQQEKYFKGIITMERLRDILGPPNYESELAQRQSVSGVVTGLAWTATGTGDILFIEASEAPGRGALQLTGIAFLCRETRRCH